MYVHLTANRYDIQWVSHLCVEIHYQKQNKQQQQHKKASHPNKQKHQQHTRIGIRLRTRAKQAFTLATAHVRDMFRQVRNALLRFELVRAARKDLQMCLETSRR
jgi:hypothetical protein